MDYLSIILNFATQKLINEYKGNEKSDKFSIIGWEIRENDARGGGERRRAMKWICRKRKKESQKTLEERQRESLPYLTMESYVKGRKRWYDEWLTFKKPKIPVEYTPYMSDIELKEWIYKDTIHRKTMEKVPGYIGMFATIISILSLTISLRQGRQRK